MNERATPAPAQGGGKATTSLVLGILSIVFCWAWYIGIILGVIGIILGALGRKSPKRNVATWGMWLSIIGVILAIVFIIIDAVVVSSMLHNGTI